MNLPNGLSAIMFTSSQITAIIIACVVLVVLIALNIGLAYYFRKRRERKLCTHQLQQKREDLLKKLADMHTVVDTYPEEQTVAVQPAMITEEDDEPDEEPETYSEVEPEAEEEEVIEEVVEVINGVEEHIVRRIRYNRSFTARIIQAENEVKCRYSDLKNELLSYKGVKSALSWKRESFRLGRNTFACFVVRGKTLCLCFATDPKRFDETKYKVIDLSVRSPKNKQPCMYRITSDRRVKFAKQIIAMLMQEYDVSQSDEFESENYVQPYRKTETLVEEGLIRIIGEKTVQPEKEHTAVQEAVTTSAAQPDTKSIENIIEEVLFERDFEILDEVDVNQADVISDEEAEQLVEDIVLRKQKPAGKKKGILNINVLSENYEAGAHVTMQSLCEKKLIANDVSYLKVLAKGTINKPLIVEADDFSLQAVKMLVLTGGRVIRRKFDE